MHMVSLLTITVLTTSRNCEIKSNIEHNKTFVGAEENVSFTPLFLKVEFVHAVMDEL